MTSPEPRATAPVVAVRHGRWSAMCVGDPGVVVTLDRAAGTARIATRGHQREASLALHPEAAVGDHVVVHTGFVLEILTPDHECRCVPGRSTVHHDRGAPG